MEIVEGKTGRTIHKKSSRISKSVLATKYIDLCRVTNSLSTLVENQNNIFYDSLKNTNINYVTAKKVLMKTFKNSDFGTWVKKPEELKTFELNVSI